jgi:pimeloyl-ACP methyl ester carboxylesterase
LPSVQANGLTLEYESRGDPGDPAIVLVMGLGVQMIFWPEALVDMLVARGFRVVRFDNRDAGLSSSLDRLGTPRILVEYAKYLLRLPLKAPYRIDDMAHDTVALMDALGIERAHLVGLSMGGMIAQNVAASFPARVLTLTSIMSSTGSRKLPSAEPRATRALLQRPARKGDIEGATRRFMHVLRTIGSRSHPTEETELRAFCERHVRRAFKPEGQVRQLVAIAATGDRTPIVKKISAPTLVIHGDEDPLVPLACGEATARAIREGGGKATFKVVKGMGHDLPTPLLPELAELISEHCLRVI